MQIPRTLYRYLSTEVIQYTLLGFVAVAAIFISQNLLKRLDELLAVGFEASDGLALFACISGMLVAYLIPVAFLFGVLLAVSRLSADSEIIAMRACGLGLRHLLAPVLVLGIICSIITAYFMIELEPRSRRELRGVLKSIASKGAAIEAGRFREFGQRVIFVSERSPDNTLAGVVISDLDENGQPFSVFAEKGTFAFDEEATAIRLTLRNGSIHLHPAAVDKERYKRISFEEFEYTFDVSAILSTAAHTERPREMKMARLYEIIASLKQGEELDPNLHERNPLDYFLQYHRRLALPLAPILFALAGVPLGLRRARGARSWGAMVSIILVFAYYMLLSFSEYLGEEGLVPIHIALWFPNVIFGVLALFLLWRARTRES